MQQKRERHCHGFTLLEILITVLLLIVGVVAVVRAMGSGTSADYYVEAQAIALQLAQEQMEEVKALPFSDIGEIPRGDDIDGFPGYQREVLVEGTDPKTVTVNVYWTLKDTEQLVTLQTLFTNLTPGSS